MANEIDVRGMRVVIVEDDPLLHSLLSDKMKQLREIGVEVYPAMSSEEGLTKAREVHPNLILLDLVLPGMTGFEFLEQLRSEPGFEKTPVIVLSNLSGDSDKARAKSLGVIGYLVKANFTLSEISGVIEEVLRGHAVPQQAGIDSKIEKTASGYMIHL